MFECDDGWNYDIDLHTWDWSNYDIDFHTWDWSKFYVSHIIVFFSKHAGSLRFMVSNVNIY